MLRLKLWLLLFLSVSLASCGKIEDEQVTIAFGPAKKAVRVGDYYWIKADEANTLIAGDAKMQPVGLIIEADNPKDYQTVLKFLEKSGK